MTGSAALSGRIVVAAQDGAVRSWLERCLAGSSVSLGWCADLAQVACLASGSVDALLVDETLLAPEGTGSPLALLQAARVPIVVIVGVDPDWQRARARLARAGGEVFDYLAAGDPLEIVTRRITTAVRVVHAEREEESLRAERLELERNRVVVQLAGAVAHKLKQPLSVAWGYLEMLLDEPMGDDGRALDPLTLRYLEEIRQAVRTMDDVVNRLQRATVYQTRQYAGALEILNLDATEPAPPGGSAG